MEHSKWLIYMHTIYTHCMISSSLPCPPDHHHHHLSTATSRPHKNVELDATIIIFQRNEAEKAFLEGKEQLDVLKRQAILGHLYPTARSVMETA